MHDKRCLAAALIATVENFRDEEGMTDFDFRLIAQDGHTILTVADAYLADGTATCLCGYRRAHAYAEDLRQQSIAWADKGQHWYAGSLLDRAAHAEATRTVT